MRQIFSAALVVVGGALATVAHPERERAIIVQNTLAREDRPGPAWDIRRAFWKDRAAAEFKPLMRRGAPKWRRDSFRIARARVNARRLGASNPEIRATSPQLDAVLQPRSPRCEEVAKVARIGA